MNTNKLREEAVKWFNELPIQSKERLFSEYKKWTPATTHQQLSVREIEYIWANKVGCHNNLEEPTLPETVEEAANKHADELYDRNDNDMPHLWENRKSNFLDGAAWQKQHDRVIISELLDALNRVNRVENAAFSLPGFNAEKMKQEMQPAITKAETYLNQK